MDKRNNSGSGCYDYSSTVVAAAPTTTTTKHYAHAQRQNNNKPKQQQQLINTTTTAAATARGNSSPKLAATFQGMSVSVVQSASSGVHSWPIARQDEKSMSIQTTTTTTTAAAAVFSSARSKQVPMMMLHKQHNNNNNAVNLQKPPAAIGQQQQHAVMSAGIRTKPRNKSEEAISDLLHRIPDIGHIFDVHSRIGNGTFSTVLLATLKRESHLPDNMRRKFAIKHHIPTSHPDRIMKELQCMTDMGGTDNVVGIHCCLRCEASAAFVMPYMPHDRFHDFYTKMDVPEIRMYMRNLLLALRHVHKFNIIHRDVKPSNFLYNRRQGQFLLVDFGLAQHVTVSQQQSGVASAPGAALQDLRRGNIVIGNSKRPRERDSLSAAQQQAGAAGAATAAASQAASLRETDATLGGAVKRMRLIEETAPSSWNKMPLKPVNEIAQSTKASVELTTPDDPKQSLADATDALGPSHVQAEQQQPASSGSSSKYNTNRSAGGGNGKCFCFANPSVCLNCLMKKEVHASRAGTPGYRPPEVLLKYADQTTAVDVWAAGVIFLSILSSVYPFFKAPNDFVALAEIVTIFGDRAIRKTALALERMVTISHRSKSLNLRKLCLRFRHRLIFSDAQMIRKYESPDGRCDVCKNCDQYFFNCLCEESDYVTEPLDSYECFPASAYDLLGRLLEINPHNRISAEEALNHPFFTEHPEIAPAAPAVVPPRKVRAESVTNTTTRRRATKAPAAGGGGGASVGAGAGAGTAAAGKQQTMANGEQLHPTLNKL
ncbi:cell division cycle 7-related protein kinase [Drosophila innubila]|uniref:cell division cycle 7-related protein kinase n=1 Tax=Drosophila innubila TaxID=198719 RepID=UPI00148C6B2B|nr:cell division cycle 7-related protein kinase [Drosophila innubila]XP_034490430.1 cell division cycle 7-related protein kinase [Drosophila innubila]